jgi:DNA helicase II / ATP-dependent DNA helicase PcrA
MFTPSKYQQDIFDFVTMATGSAIIQAVAGSGKSTTLEHIAGLLPSGDTAIFMAFNKAIATEIDKRLPKHIKGSTFHSVGFGAWMRYTGLGFKGIKVDGYKTSNILQSLLETGGTDSRGYPEFNREKYDAYSSYVTKLVGLAKNSGIGFLLPDDTQSWWNLVDHFDVSLTVDDDRYTEEEAIGYARKALRIGNENHKVIDFDDMLYLPLINKCSFFRHDWVMIDEAQDTNAVQLALVKRMLKNGGRLIAVGDRGQAIYGFRGADSSAMDKIGDAFNCTELPLSVCYRCDKTIVQAAQEFIPDTILPRDGAEWGIVQRADKGWEEDLKPGDAILCRNVAPMISKAYDLLAQGVGCYVEGRDIGKGLIDVVEKMRAKDVTDLETKLEDWTVREVEKWTSKGQETRAGSIQDKSDCLGIITNALDEQCRTIPDLIAQIQLMFADDKKGAVVLSTVHKSKGREWDRVFILGRDTLMPSPWARQEWQKVQENNLIYVAYTRAAHELYFV